MCLSALKHNSAREPRAFYRITSLQLRHYCNVSLDSRRKAKRCPSLLALGLRCALPPATRILSHHLSITFALNVGRFFLPLSRLLCRSHRETELQINMAGVAGIVDVEEEVGIAKLVLPASADACAASSMGLDFPLV